MQIVDFVPDDSIRRLFPMRLTSIEKFHLFDFTPSFTNICYSCFRFAGIVEPAAANRALELTMQRHPLWGCRIGRQGNRLQWELAFERFRDIDWHRPLNATPALPAFDLHNEPAGVPMSRIGDNQTQIGIYLQHVVADGVGTCQFIADWLRFYHNIVEGIDEHTGIRKLNPALLRHRNRLDLTSREYLKHLWKQPLGLFGATKFIFRRPAEMRPEIDDTEAWDFQRQPHVIGTWLDESVTRLLKERARREGVMMNTLLVGELFKCLQSQRIPPKKTDSKWLRVILPINLRTFADRRMPAANRATLVQIDRCARQFGRPDFYRQLDWEIGVIRNWQLGKLFSLAIRGMSLVPGGLRRAATNKKCRGTAVFTNLSAPLSRLALPIVDGDLQVGNLLLKDFDMIGPVRRRMPINFNFVKHLDRFRLSLHSDPRILSDSESRLILHDFRDRIIGLVH